ncbi:hypothetical protein EV361DRAFT_770298, partial [Lentinula raphanica]
LSSRSLRAPVDLTSWHRRFGHAGISRILMMSRKGLVDGLEIVGTKESQDLPVCDSCKMGAAKRRAFDAEVTVEKRLLERVHVDLTGPMRTRAIGGYYY